ncbi:unnamed protein product [Ambrosiozyma monospora]|uniref:Unnamed protein product n=1 Tax=Ambrosiozyma monospora TaxID=43982 RepID=A0ACB5SSA3_AMBMO|nr:unnamed protein product [Ambrosiozyma monospora]
MRFSSSSLNLNNLNTIYNNYQNNQGKGNIYNSLTLLSFIATFNTIIVVLQHGVDHLNMDDQTRATLESVAAFLRLHIGSFSNGVSLSSSRSCSSLVSQDKDADRDVNGCRVGSSGFSYHSLFDDDCFGLSSLDYELKSDICHKLIHLAMDLNGYD